MKITIARDACIDSAVATHKEWIETNGIGGYASSTIIDCHTRKYHGLLVASLQKPLGRYVLLSNIEIEATIKGKSFALSTQKYPDTYYPQGYLYSDHFDYELYPSLYYKMGPTLIRKSILMLEGENTVLLRIELLEGPSNVQLKLKPLLAFRNIHDCQIRNLNIHCKTYFETNGFKIEPYDGMPSLYINTNRKSVFYPGPDWHHNVEYQMEQQRGVESHEDLFTPGIFEVTLSKKSDLIIAASTAPIKNSLVKFKKEEKKRVSAYEKLQEKNPHLTDLKFLSGQFIIKNANQETSIIAGYHWFSQWGRDSMIALPGLTFYSSREKDGIDILKTFSGYQKDGLIPTFIEEQSNKAVYDAVDTSLWYFWALQEFLNTGGSSDIVFRYFSDTMQTILGAFLDNQVPNCHLAENGLLTIGHERSRCTWMDAEIQGVPVTPRNGMPVEINALWYNALKFWQTLAKKWQRQTNYDRVTAVIEKIEDSFYNLFWSQEQNCLGDVWNNGALDETIRPNQIFAVSLAFSPLSMAHQRLVLEKVTHDLVTPYGLRTLSPADKNYKAQYDGNAIDRDLAYHQGSVWPWLVAHYGAAYLKTAPNTKEAKLTLARQFAPLLEQFPSNFCLHSMPELYNGNPPHQPNGCISQAWSFGEIIRLHAMIGNLQ